MTASSPTSPEAEIEQIGDLVNSESVYEAETSPVSERGAGHQGPAEAGTVPLGLVAAIQSEARDQSCAGVGVRKAVCEQDRKKRRYIGVKKAVPQGFYEIEREALYEKN